MSIDNYFKAVIVNNKKKLNLVKIYYKTFIDKYNSLEFKNPDFITTIYSSLVWEID